MILQATLKQKLSFFGVGVHSGKQSHITLMPAPEGYGIRFEHVDFPHDIITVGQTIPEPAPHATVLRAQQWTLSTVEHLMAALYMCGIDNLHVVVDSGELPILDGSAQPFVVAMRAGGIQHQTAPRSFYTVTAPITLADGQQNREIVLMPSMRELTILYDAEFSAPVWGSSSMSCSATEAFCATVLAPARTFGSLADWPALKKIGLAQGSSLENTLVQSEGCFINEPRFPDECLRHKVLDLIGDLMLLGLRLRAHITARKTGHAFNARLIRHRFEHPQSWKRISDD